MSYILEALRKAQREQRRSQAPDLRAAVGAAVASPRRPTVRWAWAAAALLLGVNALALVWAFRLQPSPPAVPLSPGPAARAPLQGSPPDPAATPSGPPTEAPPAVTDAIVAPRVPPVTRPLVGELEHRSPMPPVSGPERSPAEPVSRAAPSAPPRSAGAPAVPQTAPALPETAPAERPSPALSAPEAETAREPTVSPGPPPERTVAGPPVSAPVPLFADLAPAVRQGLPALEINGHVYAEDRRERFVFIDWKGYREGDRIGAADGPLLERITREGIVVDFGAVRARVPVVP